MYTATMSCFTFQAAIEFNYDHDRRMIAMLVHNEDYNKQMTVINDYKQVGFLGNADTSDCNACS